MSAALITNARLWREKMLKANAPLTKAALRTNVKRHTALEDYNLDEAVDADIDRNVAHVMRDRDKLGRLFYPCGWDDSGRIVRWDHRDAILLEGWERNLDARVEQEVTDRKAKRRVFIIVEVLRQAAKDAGRDVSFSECEPEIVRRWQKAKVMP